MAPAAVGNNLMLTSSEFSPPRYARIGGVLYLLIIAAGLFAEAFVRNRLIVPGNATATASNVRAPSIKRVFTAQDLVAAGFEETHTE